MRNYKLLQPGPLIRIQSISQSTSAGDARAVTKFIAKVMDLPKEGTESQQKPSAAASHHTLTWSSVVQALCIKTSGSLMSNQENLLKPTTTILFYMPSFRSS